MSTSPAGTQPWNAPRLLATSSAYWQSSALHAAVRLDFFGILAQQPLAGAEVARQAKTHPVRTESLLNALAAMGLLAKDERVFRNSSFSRQYLCSDSPDYLGYIILHHHHLVDGWAQLDQAVASGLPVERRSYGEEFERQCFQLGMMNLALLAAPQVADAVDLAGRRSLLDLGGGPGTYAIHFCLRYPELSATVFDRPANRPTAEQTIERFGTTDRVRFHAGDFFIDEIPGGHDVVWASHILHSSGPEACEDLLRRAAQALAPGGLILVQEFVLDETMDRPLFPALFSLNMHVTNTQGRSYSGPEIEAMLRAVGCTSVWRLPYRGPNDTGILAGVVD